MSIMRLAILLAACTTGCSEAAQNGTAAAGNATEVAAETSRAGYEIAVRCQASFDAVSRLYAALSKQSAGTEREEMSAVATEREVAASAYRDIARRVGADIGQSEAEIANAIGAADSAIKVEFDRRPFEDFATWVAQEADRCPPPTTV